MFSYLLIFVMATVTIAIRFAPFVLFRKKAPAFILYLGKTLPACAMAMLVVYCVRNGFDSMTDFLPQCIAAAAVIISYHLKKNTALSVFLGTLLYMFLVQRVF